MRWSSLTGQKNFKIIFSPLCLYLRMSHHGLRVQPDILISIYGQVLGSNLHFQNRQKKLEGEELCVRSTHSSASHYWVMVNYPGVLSGLNASLLFQWRQLNSQSWSLVPQFSILRLYPYVVFIPYIAHALLILSLIIGMHKSSLGLNNVHGHPNYKSGIAAVWGWNYTTS